MPFIILGKVFFFSFILVFYFTYAYSSHFIFYTSYSLSVLSTSLSMICQKSYLYLPFDSLIFSAVSNLLLSSFIWFFIVFTFLLILQFPFVLLFKFSVSYENLSFITLSARSIVILSSMSVPHMPISAIFYFLLLLIPTVLSFHVHGYF